MVYGIPAYIYIHIIWCKHAGSRTVSEMITDGPFLVHDVNSCDFFERCGRRLAHGGT